MSQLRDTEFRLTSVIHEGRDLMRVMKQHREELQKIQLDTAPSMKALKAEIVATVALVIAKEKEIKAEITAAAQIVNHIEGHMQWKVAVRALWGADGVNACIDHMQTEKHKREELTA